MKTKLTLIFTLLIVVLSACTQEPKYGTVVQTPEALLKDVMSFWNYKTHHIRLYEAFTPLDSSLQIIPEATFMQRLGTGDYLPVKRLNKENKAFYQLHRLGGSVDQDTRSTLANWAREEYANYKLRGTKLPSFAFTDLDGNVYTNKNTAGKTLVLKCWFIRCTACVAEMPELNKLKQKYKNRNDILFVSLATDKAPELEKFLKKRQFDYAVAPEQRTFIVQGLQVGSYPTHFVIDKAGQIRIKTTDYKAMAYVLAESADQE